ncbi:TonB family protein [Qipengyuania aquimaris]|uniref:TonB family protein n=1 Tax=Qipengyuania aquimaris TaxID=255984 RepID=A0A9Q3XD37_9SPHN|nr:TonB family protein [Qipengyuania aquimaris]
MSETATRFSTTRKRLNPWVIVLILLIHLGIFYVLIRALAPTAVASVEQTVVSAFTVTVSAPEEETPVTEPEPDEGAQGDPGEEAVPQPVSAPTPRQQVREDRPVPRAASTGSATTSGATQSGDGTGAAGSGTGTGSGRGGSGQGGVAATKPVLIRSITDSSAFPIPPGGREARIGESVIVRLTVNAQGRVTACSVYRPSPFPETDAVVCRLSYEQIRFEPARDAQGNPVPAPFYYRQRFFN